MYVKYYIKLFKFYEYIFLRLPAQSLANSPLSHFEIPWFYFLMSAKFLKTHLWLQFSLSVHISSENIWKKWKHCDSLHCLTMPPECDVLPTISISQYFCTQSLILSSLSLLLSMCGCSLMVLCLVAFTLPLQVVHRSEVRMLVLLCPPLHHASSCITHASPSSSPTTNSQHTVGTLIPEDTQNEGHLLHVWYLKHTQLLYDYHCHHPLTVTKN